MASSNEEQFQESKTICAVHGTFTQPLQSEQNHTFAGVTRLSRPQTRAKTRRNRDAVSEWTEIPSIAASSGELRAKLLADPEFNFFEEDDSQAQATDEKPTSQVNKGKAQLRANREPPSLLATTIQQKTRQANATQAPAPVAPATKRRYQNYPSMPQRHDLLWQLGYWGNNPNPLTRAEIASNIIAADGLPNDDDTKARITNNITKLVKNAVKAVLSKRHASKWLADRERGKMNKDPGAGWDPVGSLAKYAYSVWSPSSRAQNGLIASSASQLAVPPTTSHALAATLQQPATTASARPPPQIVARPPPQLLAPTAHRPTVSAAAPARSQPREGDLGPSHSRGPVASTNQDTSVNFAIRDTNPRPEYMLNGVIYSGQRPFIQSSYDGRTESSSIFSDGVALTPLQTNLVFFSNSNNLSQPIHPAIYPRYGQVIHDMVYRETFGQAYVINWMSQGSTSDVFGSFNQRAIQGYCGDSGALE